MSLPRIIERTIYPILVGHLKDRGIEAIGEAGASDGNFSDILFKIKEELFLIEVKIGKASTTLGLKAMAQAERYARKYKTRNFMVLIFPESYRNQPISSTEMLERLIINERATCIIFSDYWTESLIDTPINIFNKLKNLVETNKQAIDFKTIVEQIKTFVTDLNSITYQVKTDQLISEVVEKLDLFTAIGDIKDKEIAKKQIVHLSSYLLFNQLLFYHTYHKLTQKNKTPELEEIKKVEDINRFFDKITKIDYKSIYKTNILAHIPNTKEVVEVLNDVIGAIKLLRAEFVTHDLAGRFFHDLIPFEVRKVLAAFYTHPNSADLLTGLTIRSWNETVLDPSCGSGTLLVSSYQTKLRYYLASHDKVNYKGLHKKFLEDDITGIDIMPFASHITTINLAMQHIEQQTNLVRIASINSLDLAGQLKTKEFLKGKGIKISGLQKSLQQTLFGQHVLINKRGSVSMEGKGEEFYLIPNDCIIMNPPFSDREKMPKDMRDKLNRNNFLNNTSGNQVNLWGSFIVLADLLLKKNGKLGAVIPINIARGEATQLVRSFILKNYTAEFIIKPLGDDAFSEGSFFKDILYIAEKRKPKDSDYTGIVSIKSSIKNLSQSKIYELVDKLNQCYNHKKDFENEDIEIRYIKTQKLLDYENNLMPLIGFTSHKNKDIFSLFLETIKEKSDNKLMKIDSEIVSEGFHASPSGLSELVFITRPIDKARTERAFMILKDEKSNSIVAEIKDSDILININNTEVYPALRTLTSVKSFDVEKIDYILIQKPNQFDKILQMSKWKGKFNWFEHKKNVDKKLSYVVVGRRFRPNSKNTHHFAFYSKNGIVSPHTFKILNFKEPMEAMIQTLILNSSITISNILSFREQTTGGFTDIMESELCSFDIFNIKNLSHTQLKTLEQLYNNLKSKEFPSIHDQFVTNNEYRRFLDETILEILGFKKNEIDKILGRLYLAITQELETKG